jgi:FkbM family methyltransferase
MSIEPARVNLALKASLPAWAWSCLQHAKAKFSEWTFRHRIVRHDYGGHSMLVHLKDPMSQKWYDCDWERPEEIELLSQSRLKSGARVFDIGAHQSVVAMMLASEVGNSGSVVALEPNPFNTRMGQLNIQSNRFGNIVLLQAMVSSTNGSGMMSFQLNGRPISSGSGAWGLNVPSITIDEIARRYGAPDVVFVDIEGYEFEALKAANEVMTQDADWCIELHGDEVLAMYGATNAEVVDQFLKKDFEVHIKAEGVRFSRISSTSMVPNSRCHMVAVRSSIH